MSNRKGSKNNLIFKSSQTFTFPETGEIFVAQVKLASPEVVRLKLHDFKACFTLRQAYEVASGLIKAAINAIGPYDENTKDFILQESFDHWTTLLERNGLLASAAESDLLHVVMAGRDFLVQGVLLDPDSAVEFRNGDQALYDFQIVLDGESISMRFGWVSWSFSHRETVWLAEQLLTAVFLATRPQTHLIQ